MDKLIDSVAEVFSRLASPAHQTAENVKFLYDLIELILSVLILKVLKN
jgi:hypothetical protein